MCKYFSEISKIKKIENQIFDFRIFRYFDFSDDNVLLAFEKKSWKKKLPVDLKPRQNSTLFLWSLSPAKKNDNIWSFLAVFRPLPSFESSKNFYLGTAQKTRIPDKFSDKSLFFFHGFGSPEVKISEWTSS